MPANAASDHDLRQALDALALARPGFWSRAACGVTRAHTAIPALLDRSAYAADTPRARVLLLGGLSGRAADVDMALHALELYAGGGDALALRIGLSAVPCANPDGLRLGVAPSNGVGGHPARGYPPVGNFYDDEQNPEKRYLWRWIIHQAPDLLLEVQSGAGPVRWECNAAARPLAPALAARETRGDTLINALGEGTPDGLGVIPGLRLTANSEQLPRELSRLFGVIRQENVPGPSPARRALNARRQRRPAEIGRILARAYGQTFNPTIYTQAIPISGRLRLAQLDPASPDPRPEIVNLLRDFVNAASTTPGGFGADLPPAALAAVIWGDELSGATNDPRYANLIIDAANRYQPAPTGQAPPPCDPDYRTEDLFMAAAILGRAHQLTARPRYLDILSNLILQGEIQQENGLFQHSRTAPFYWGRGNGFAALGLTEALTWLPQNHPARPAIQDMYLRLMESLCRLQRPSGLLPQVLDFPGSYDEFTAACMLGYALARGLRRHWLPPEYRAHAEQAWQGIAERIDDIGQVTDACASTGAQLTVRRYLDRPAIHGHDDRSGGLSLWFAVEMERLTRGI